MFDKPNLISSYRRKKLNEEYSEEASKKIEGAYNFFCRTENNKQYKASIMNLMEFDGIFKYYELSSVSGRFRYCFAQDNFETALNILGRDSKFKLCRVCGKSSSVPICIIESDYGKGMVLGLCK